MRLRRRVAILEAELKQQAESAATLRRALEQLRCQVEIGHRWIPTTPYINPFYHGGLAVMACRNCGKEKTVPIIELTPNERLMFEALGILSPEAKTKK